MAYNDIKAWRELMDAKEQEQRAYEKACRMAEIRAAKIDQQEFDELDQVQIDPSTLKIPQSTCLGFEDLPDDEIDFSIYGLTEADLGVGPADEHTKLEDVMREPLVRIPAAMGRPASTADLAAQDLVKLMMETFKKFNESKKADTEILDEEMYEEDDSEALYEEDETPVTKAEQKIEDEIEKISDNDDYPLTDEDWAEIAAEDDIAKKIELIQTKVKDIWDSLSVDAKREIKTTISDLRKELLIIRNSELKFKEALSLQRQSETRKLSAEEQKKFADIVKYDLTDEQREILFKKAWPEGVKKYSYKVKIPNSKDQSGNVQDYHSGEDSIERRNETGLDTIVDVSKYPYIPEPMEPGEIAQSGFYPEFQGAVKQRQQLRKDFKEIGDKLKPGHAERRKHWRRSDIADKIDPETFYTVSGKTWKQIVDTLTPEEKKECIDELMQELEGLSYDNKDMLEFMFGDMKVPLKKLAMRMGYGSDLSGKTGGLTQSIDKIVNLFLIILAKYLNVATIETNTLINHLRNESQEERNIRKRVRPIIFNEIGAECNINLDTYEEETGVKPDFDGGVAAKNAAQDLVMQIFFNEWPQMSEQDKSNVIEQIVNFHNGSHVRKFKAKFDEKDNSEFLQLLSKVRNENDLSPEERIRFLQLDIMRRTGMEEAAALEQANLQYQHQMAQQNGETKFLNYVIKVAKNFLHGQSPNHTRDHLRFIPIDNDNNEQQED